MKKHEKVYMDEKTYPCKYCNKKFNMMESVNGHVYIDREENLKSHVESVHKGNKPYNCDICCKQFQFISFMKQHTESVH